MDFVGLGSGDNADSGDNACVCPGGVATGEDILTHTGDKGRAKIFIGYGHSFVFQRYLTKISWVSHEVSSTTASSSLF